jgi:cyclophilin family peptidyl-prolyl cis-trans isomerase
MKRLRALPLLATAGVAALAGCVPDGVRPDPSAASLTRVLEAEDARPTGGPQLDVLVDGARSRDATVRRTAVRALGRLEAPALSAEIARHLADVDARVRAAAAEALAQTVHGQAGASVLPDLLARVDLERDGRVRGALGRSIGRLALDSSADRRRAAGALTALAGSAGESVPLETQLGVALGFEALLRGAGDDGLDRAAAERLGAWAANAESPHVRALALAALGRARRLSLDDVGRAQDDPDPEVRRTVLGYLSAVAPSRRPAILRRALEDPSPRVVIDAIRIVAAEPRTPETCAWLLGAAAPPRDAAVRLVALEALATPCPDASAQSELLRAAASELPVAASATWQPAARALMSLARIDGPAARDALPRYVEHPSPFVRAYAAAAAGLLVDASVLESLAADPSPNVRGAALEALFATRGHRIDDLLLDQLSADDPQLLRTIAGLLEGSPGRSAVAAALAVKLERLSAARTETWRDARRALVARIAELGDASLAPRLRPYLADYDAVVASDVADVLGRWTGDVPSIMPAPLPRAPLPSRAQLVALERTSVALHMRSGGTIVIALLPDLAPRNAWRFVSLARAGYFDGLTFHRWVANFVIQGGSPGANEYAGDAPYTRDEVGGSHWRGTVGVSTRGRDTGDGQIFINLVDNVRLDHDYTVFGFVSEGTDVVDAVLEGAVIERAEVRTES